MRVCIVTARHRLLTFIARHDQGPIVHGISSSPTYSRTRPCGHKKDREMRQSDLGNARASTHEASPTALQLEHYPRAAPASARL